MGIVQKNVQLSEENVKTFEARYPKGSLSWILDMLLEKFNSVQQVSPEEYAALAAKELGEELDVT